MNLKMAGEDLWLLSEGPLSGSVHGGLLRPSLKSPLIGGGGCSVVEGIRLLSWST